MDGFFQVFFSVGRFFRARFSLVGEGLGKAISRVFLYILLGREGLDLSVSRDGVRPFTKIVVGAGEKTIDVGQILILGFGLDEFVGQLHHFLELSAVVGIKDLFGLFDVVVLSQKGNGKEKGQDQGGGPEGEDGRFHGRGNLTALGMFSPAELKRFCPCFQGSFVEILSLSMTLYLPSEMTLVS